MKAGWEIKPLGKLTAKIGSGATPKGGRNAYKQEGIALIRSMNVHDLQFRVKDLARIDEDQATKLSIVEVEKNDVLLNITGASIARCCVVPDDIIPARVNQHVAIIRPKQGEVDPEFLAYLLVSKEHKDKLLGIGDDAGATRQALTKSHIQNYEIPIPPLEEQKRIVAVLDAAFERLTRAADHAETNLQNARELFESYLENSYQGEFRQATQLRDLIEISHGYAFKSKDFEAIVDKSLPVVLTPGNYTEDARIDIGTKRTKRLLSADVPTDYLFNRGELTVVMTDLSSKMKILGLPAFVEADSVLHNQRIGRVKFKNDDLSSKYLYYYLRTAAARNRIKATASGTMVRHTAPTRILDLEIPLIGPDEQQAVVLKLDDLAKKASKLKELFQSKLTDIADLRQSLLQKAFAGELT